MKFSRANLQHANRVVRYDASSITVALGQPEEQSDNTLQQFSQNVLLSATQCHTDIPTKPLADYSAENLLNLITGFDIVIIGHSTANFATLNTSVQLATMQQGIGLELMPIDAACRTYNLLLEEARSVALLILRTKSQIDLDQLNCR